VDVCRPTLFGWRMSPPEGAEIPLSEARTVGADPWLETRLDHPEDVAVSPTGLLYTGGEAGQVYRVDPVANTVTEIANTGGAVLGVAFGPEGDLYACDFQEHAVFRLPMDGNRVDGDLTAAVTGGPDRPPLHPNDVAFDRSGRLYVSDSGHRDRLPGPFEDSGGCIYAVDPDGTGRVLTDELSAFPNGIALSGDGETLYVCETGTHRIAAVRLDDGEAVGIDTVTEDCGMVDGVALDARERLYVASIGADAVYRIDDGDVDTVVADPQGQIVGNLTNVAFGGPDMCTLYVANLALWHVTAVEVDVPGRVPTGRL